MSGAGQTGTSAVSLAKCLPGALTGHNACGGRYYTGLSAKNTSAQMCLGQIVGLCGGRGTASATLDVSIIGCSVSDGLQRWYSGFSALGKSVGSFLAWAYTR